MKQKAKKQKIIKQETTKKEATRTLNKKMLERLVIVHNAIKSGAYPDNERLRRIYCEKTGYSNVGEATINRDIDTLRTYFHAPLEFDRQKNGYYYSSDWDFAYNNLSADELFYLSAAKTLLSSFAGSPIYNAISEVIDFVTDAQTSGKSALLKRIAIPPAPRVVTDEFVWKTVLRAMRENLIVAFDYNGRWRTATTHRRVRPYQLLLDDGQCYIFGYAEERKAERLFALNRIKNIEVTAERFALPKNYEFSSRCGGGKFGVFISGHVVKFVVDFYGDARQYVKECVWADDQVIKDVAKQGKTRIMFSSAQTLKVREWILAQGGNAIPVSPKWFVDDWKATVKKMAKNAGLE